MGAPPGAPIHYAGRQCLCPQSALNHPYEVVSADTEAGFGAGGFVWKVCQ
jgi:hypothetical protein